jgi:hypothetical protein
MNRRELMAGFLETAVLSLLGETLSSADLLSSGASRGVAEWTRAQEEVARRLRSHAISGRIWQSEVESLARGLDRDALLRAIDFPKLTSTMVFEKEGATKRSLRLPHPDDPARRLSFGTALFGLPKGRAITPHGHRNMVSAHLVLGGRLHVRNFDRAEDAPGRLLLTPTVDAAIAPGDCSTMSSERNNVHWFVALTETAYTFDVVVDGLEADAAPYVIELVDPRGAERLADGRLRARVIGWEESVRLYGEERTGA